MVGGGGGRVQNIYTPQKKVAQKVVSCIEWGEGQGGGGGRKKSLPAVFPFCSLTPFP